MSFKVHYVTAYTNDSMYDTLVKRTDPPGLDKPRNRPGIMPQVMTLIDENASLGQRRDLTYAQGLIPMLVEQRGTYDTGYWTLYWTSDRGGWAARTPRPCIVDRPGAQYALFKRIDASRCTHPNMRATEHSSTYRTFDCPDCGAHDSHDSGD